METLVCTEPGHLEYKETDLPVSKAGNVIIRITHIGVCGTDLHAFEGTQPYFTYPRILGHEIAAIIEDPADADTFKTGDRVTFIPYFNCGFCVACRNGKPNCCVKLQVSGVHVDGGMRTHLSVPANTLVDGKGLSGEALALIEPLAIGAHGIKRSGAGPGQNVLVIGAGPIGLGAMQFAALAGARVIAMDVNESRLDFCRQKLNIPYTINARDHDVNEQLAALTNGEMATVVIDATGNIHAINNGFHFIAHGGTYVLIGLQKQEIHFSHPEFHKREATLMSSRNATRSDFEYVMEMIRNNMIDPLSYITHRVNFGSAADQFPGWLKQDTGVIKAMIIMQD